MSNPNWLYETNGWKLIDGHWTDVNGNGFTPESLAKVEAYQTGRYGFPVPPVSTAHWNDSDWIRYIDMNNGWL